MAGCPHRLLAASLLVLLAGPPLAAATPSPPVNPLPPDRIRGVCFVAGRSLPEDPFGPIARLGAGWISQTPFAWQMKTDAPEIRLVTSGRVYWGETDEGIRETARRARAAGLRTLLNPHIWIRDHDAWRGRIAMSSEEDWARWFAGYREVVLHYARLAAAEKIEAFAVGTELGGTVHRESAWRALIAETRGVYPGILLYAANWDEAERVPFWDALDAIGIQAYYPLAEAIGSDDASVRAAWRRKASDLEALAGRWGRRILFTEAGYRSQADTLVEPWLWKGAGPADPPAQSRGWTLLFESVWDRPWFAGLFVWKWFPDHGKAGGPDDPGFTPQRKPAEEVIRSWFLRP